MQKRIQYHIAFWLAYILFKSYLNFDSGAFPVKGVTGINLFLLSVAVQSIFLIIKIPLVYSLFYITDKYLAKQWDIIKTIIVAVVLFAVGIAGFITINSLVVIKLILHMQTHLWAGLSSLSSISYSFFILCFVSGIAIAIKLVRLNIRQKALSQEIMKKKLETELQFLKAQTNPHFLFNTLNNIYALARKKSDHTADVVMKLSKLLRFMLYESQKQTILLSDEIHVLEDYIELERIRYDEKLKLSFTRSVDNDMQPIAPLILLPFVENAFKHGASESRFSSYINIDLKLQQHQLHFTVENSKTEEPVNIIPENIGLNNIRRQLELLYPGHSLEIESSNNRFTVSLKINLNNYATV